MLRRIVSFRVLFLSLVTLLYSLSVSFGNDFLVPVTVTNRTTQYLHISINDESFTFVAPEGVVQREVSTDGVTIQAVYSPGQTQSGAFSRSYPTISREFTPSESSSCHSGSNSCEQSTAPKEVRTPLPVQVEIRSSDLQ